MIAITLFYLLFLILLILLIFIILLYSGYHSRTIAPPLLDTFYGINGESGNNIPVSGSSFQTLTLTDGEGVFSSGVSGGLDFGSSSVTHQSIGFRPMFDDSQRKLRGNIILLINKQDSSTPNLNLQIIDSGDNNRVVGSPTAYDVIEQDQGLGEIKLYFTSGKLSGNNRHLFQLQGKSSSSGTSITTNQILLNSAYIYYY
jgi:hypothetical protein